MSLDQMLLLPPGYGFDSSNALPGITVPGAQSATSNVALAITGTSIADTDSNPQTVTLSVSHGTFSLASTTGLSFSIGDGTADATMTFSGSVANVNTAIATLTYTSTTDYDGADSLAISTNDGAGGLDSDSVAITVDYTPLSSAALFEWMDGSARIYSDGGSTAAIENDGVQQWTGVNGSVGSEATNKPVYHLGANGEGYIQGDASKSIRASFTSKAFTACELWVTAKRPGNMAAGEIAQISSSPSDIPLFQFSRITNTTACAIVRNNASTLVQSSTTAVGTSWQTLRISWDGTDVRFYSDNVLVDTDAFTGTLTMTHFAALGNVVGGGKIAAQLAQAVIFDAALTAGEATNMQAYLASRFPT